MRTLDFGLFLLRLALAIVFLAHGGQKLFVYGMDGVAGSFAKMGIPFPGVAAVVVSLVEFGGGLALLVGLGTRIAAALIAITMLVAVVQVHLPAGFFLPRGYEFALTLLLASLALVLTGPGRYSIDSGVWRRRP